ncbi:hypothetical protein MKX03_018136 [Papaver bracteatum]|nr:hypothetical protein MKX03_018136 [Papaver bracteatum]
MESEQQNFGNSEESKQTISSNDDLSKNNEMNEKKLKNKKSLIFRFGCLRSQTSSPDRSSSDEKPYMEMESVTSEDGPPPTHLVFMVNGILGSPEDWRSSAKLYLKRYPKEFLVHFMAYNRVAFLSLMLWDLLYRLCVVILSGYT